MKMEGEEGCKKRTALSMLCECIFCNIAVTMVTVELLGMLHYAQHGITGGKDNDAGGYVASCTVISTCFGNEVCVVKIVLKKCLTSDLNQLW